MSLPGVGIDFDEAVGWIENLSGLADRLRREQLELVMAARFHVWRARNDRWVGKKQVLSMEVGQLAAFWIVTNMHE